MAFCFVVFFDTNTLLFRSVMKMLGTLRLAEFNVFVFLKTFLNYLAVQQQQINVYTIRKMVLLCGNRSGKPLKKKNQIDRFILILYL